MEQITDQKVVETVQRRLFELGYVNADLIDGKLGKKTEASILDFRNREGLPLRPIIDDRLLSVLATADPLERPARQTEATSEEIAPKVEAVSKTAEIKKTSWLTKIGSWAAGAGGLIIAGLSKLIDQFDDAVNVIAPVRSLFAEVPWELWLAGFGLIAVILAIVAGKTQSDAGIAEDKLVSGYRAGTVKFDAAAEPTGVTGTDAPP